MVRYLLQRASMTVPLLLVLPIVLFLMMHFAPGDPIDAVIGEYPVPPEYRAELERLYGFDQPVLVQLWRFFVSAITFDFGFSYSQNLDVSQLVLSRLGPTLLLVASGIAVSSLIGFVIGVAAGLTTSRRVDSAVTSAVIVSLAVPSFWIGQILVLVFALQLGWFPSTGMVSLRSGTLPTWLDIAHHLVLPLLALVIVEYGAVARVTRAATLEVLGMDYLVTAEMKGLSPRRITWMHVLRNASLPAVTVVGARFGRAIAGSLMIEVVFAWPGMGSLLYSAVTGRENQIILGIVMVIGVAVVVVNLLTDLIYSLIDPRIRNA